MRGIDTNVIVRLVTKDDAAQWKRAHDVVAGAAASSEKLFVDAIALCETVWVLKTAYREPRERIVSVLQALLETPEVVVEDADLARRATEDYARKGDFADHFMARRNRRSGCATTLTFDESLAGAEAVTLL